MADSIGIPALFQSKDKCCGCGACMNVCPRRAISMREDEYGFIYPQIEEGLCIGCERCKQVCAFQNRKTSNHVINVYAAATKEKDVIVRSASGGIFATLANKWVDNGGIVFGAAFKSDWGVHHISVVNREEICKLQGSKYTQSSTEHTFQEVKQLLQQGRKVLYSGTPCQIAGLYGYLGKRDENLATIDIVCHGVPSNRMFQEYLKLVGERRGGEIADFTFRDKSAGWGKNGKAEFGLSKGNRTAIIWSSASSYLSYFGNGWICRDSCYNCPYACDHRPADLTLGDYWGIEKAHPEYLGRGGFNEAEGISLILVNTEKGQRILERNRECMELRESDFDKASERNMQLRQPSEKGRRDEILESYLQGGWRAVDKIFYKNVGWKKYSSQIKALMPLELKRKIKGKMA